MSDKHLEGITPLAENEVYAVYIEELEGSPHEQFGFEFSSNYAVLNTETGVVEYRTLSLPQALSYLVMAGAEVTRYDEYFDSVDTDEEQPAPTPGQIVSLFPKNDED